MEEQTLTEEGDETDSEDLCLAMVKSLALEAEAAESDHNEDDVDKAALGSLVEYAKKAWSERKRTWAETGESFVLDHFEDTTMKVEDWIKENLVSDLSADMDISTSYGNYCKMKKSKLIQVCETKKTETISEKGKKDVRKSVVVTTTKTMMTHKVVEQQTSSAIPKRAYTQKKHDRKAFKSLEDKENARSKIDLTPTKKLSRQKSVPKTPRQSMIIYTPVEKQVPYRFKEVLKMKTFDPSATLVYEPPSEDLSSSESDDDVFLTNKRLFGGTIYEI